jgi:hypothetical protein
MKTSSFSLLIYVLIRKHYVTNLWSETVLRGSAPEEFPHQKGYDSGDGWSDSGIWRCARVPPSTSCYSCIIPKDVNISVSKIASQSSHFLSLSVKIAIGCGVCLVSYLELSVAPFKKTCHTACTRGHEHVIWLSGIATFWRWYWAHQIKFWPVIGVASFLPEWVNHDGSLWHE